MKKRKLKKGVKRLLIGFILLTVLLVGYLSFSKEISSMFKKETKQTVKKEKKKIEEPVDTSLFRDYKKQAIELVSIMTLEEKVGQVFLVRYNQEDVEEWNQYYPGGYILFAKDFEYHNQYSIQREIAHDQEISKYPLIMGVDEEGGYVTRVSRFENFREDIFASPRNYYDWGGYELLEQTEKEKAELLTSIGINLNLAPVADLSTNPNDFIYNRSFGYGVEETSEFIKNMVEYSKKNHINSCLKHFPGYGNNEDTHTGVAIDYRDYDTFINNDYKPFEAGIEAGVPSILVSHNVVMSIDPDFPSSLSKKVISELRKKLNFTGIIMTDDLAMDAVKDYVENKNAATLAIQAGCDMIITSDFESMRNELIDAIQNGVLSEDILNEAVIRIMSWKYYSGLF